MHTVQSGKGNHLGMSSIESAISTISGLVIVELIGKKFIIVLLQCGLAGNCTNQGLCPQVLLVMLTLGPSSD